MPGLSKGDLFSNLYYCLDEGLGSAQALYNQATHKNMSITLGYVNTWIKKQPNKQRKGYKVYNSYKTLFPRFEYHIYIYI